MFDSIKTLVRDEEGSVAIEYGALAALSSASLVCAFAALGDATANLFSRVTDVVNNIDPNCAGSESGGGKGILGGVKDALMNPIKSTLHPVQTMKSIINI